MVFALLAAIAVCQSHAIRPERESRRSAQLDESLGSPSKQPLKSLVALDVASTITEGSNPGAQFITVPSTFTFLEVHFMVMAVLALLGSTLLWVLAPRETVLSHVAALWQFGYVVGEPLALVTLWASTDNVRVVADSLTGGFFAFTGVAAVALVMACVRVARGEVVDRLPGWLMVALPASVLVTVVVGASGAAAPQAFGLGLYSGGRISLAVYWVGLAAGLWGHSGQHEWKRMAPVRAAGLSCGIFLLQPGLAFVAPGQQAAFALGWAMLPGVAWGVHFMNSAASEAVPSRP